MDQIINLCYNTKQCSNIHCAFFHKLVVISIKQVTIQYLGYGYIGNWLMGFRKRRYDMSCEDHKTSIWTVDDFFNKCNTINNAEKPANLLKWFRQMEKKSLLKLMREMYLRLLWHCQRNWHIFASTLSFHGYGIPENIYLGVQRQVPLHLKIN